MNRLYIRIVHTASTVSDSAPHGNPRTPQQLSLFDFQPKSRLVCLAMNDLHGATFQKIVCGLRPRATIDLRKFPYFDLVGINRRSALDTLERNAIPYFHIPLELRAPSDQVERWNLRKSAFSALSKLPTPLLDGETTLMAFVNRSQDVEVLGNSLRHSNEGKAWHVEPAISRQAAFL